MEQGLAEQRVVLETSRLRLREFVPQDVDALSAVLGDPVAMQYYPAPFDRKGVEEWIERNRSRYQSDGYGLWAMVLKDSGELIGDCGCFLRDIDGRDDIEIGYHVRRDLWGNGYATEAAQACMQYAFTRLGVDHVISLIRPENLQSVRVAEKNGLTCEKIIFWRGYDHCIYVKNRG
ncbi:MAG TPA: GNAT family N-acetyltransferase [Candidatus Angelobacter sp.]|nr:GNAT family N-acetyltransferase [Candidatus Angelobacter sp.]